MITMQFRNSVNSQTAVTVQYNRAQEKPNALSITLTKSGQALIHFIARCTIVQNAVLRSHVVCSRRWCIAIT